MRYTNWDFRRRVPTYAKFNPNQPRGDNGRWISNGAAADAAGSIEKAAALFKGVSKPDQQAKLVKFLQEKGMSEADAKKAQDLALSGGGAPAAGGATDGKKPAGDTKPAGGSKPAGGDGKVYNAGTDKEYREYQSKIAGQAGVMPTDVAAVEDANFGFGAKSSHGEGDERIQGLAEETGLGEAEVVRVLKGLEDRQAAAKAAGAGKQPARFAATNDRLDAARDAARAKIAAKQASGGSGAAGGSAGGGAAAPSGPVEMPKGNRSTALKAADIKAPGMPDGVKLDATERAWIEARSRELSTMNAPDVGRLRSLADLRDGKPLSPAQHAALIADTQNRYDATNGSATRDMKSSPAQSRIADSILRKLGTDAHANFQEGAKGQRAASLPPAHDKGRQMGQPAGAASVKTPVRAQQVVAGQKYNVMRGDQKVGTIERSASGDGWFVNGDPEHEFNSSKAAIEHFQNIDPPSGGRPASSTAATAAGGGAGSGGGGGKPVASGAEDGGGNRFSKANLDRARAAAKTTGVQLSDGEKAGLGPRIAGLQASNNDPATARKLDALTALRDGKPLTDDQYAAAVEDLQNVYDSTNIGGVDKQRSLVAHDVLNKIGVDAHVEHVKRNPGRAGKAPLHAYKTVNFDAPSSDAGSKAKPGVEAPAMKSALDELGPAMHRMAADTRAEADPNDPEDNHMVDPAAIRMTAGHLAEEYVFANAKKLGVDLEDDDRRIAVTDQIADAMTKRFQAEDKPPAIGGGGEARLPSEPEDKYDREFMRDFESRHGVGWSDIAQQPSAMKAATDSLLDDPGIGWADHFEKNGLTTRDQKRASILEAAKQNPSVQVELLQHLEGVQEATGKTHIKPAPKPKPDGPQFKTMDLFGGDSGGAPAPAAGGASARPEVASAIASAKKDVDEMTGYTRNMMNLEAVDGAGQGLERAGVTKGYDESNAVAHHLMGLPKPPEVDDAVWNAAGQKAATLTPEQAQTARDSALEAMTGPHSAVHKFATYSGNTSGKWDPDINPELGGQDGYDAVAKEAAQHFINTQTKLGAGTAAAPAAAPAPAPEATAPAARAAPAPQDDFQLTGAPKPPKAAPRYQRMSNRAAQGGAKLAGTGLVEGMSAPGTMSMLETSVDTGGSQIRAMKIPGADDDGTAKAVAYHVIGRQSWFDPEDDGPKAGITAEQWQRGQEIAAKMNPRQQNQVKNAVLKKLKEPGSELHYEASGDGTGDGKFDSGKHEIHREDGITNQAAYDAMIHHGALRWLNGRDG